MYIIASLYLDKAPRLGVTHVKDTLEEAIDVAVQLAVEQGAGEAEAREELTNDLDYWPNGGEWSVCIGQAE